MKSPITATHSLFAKTAALGVLSIACTKGLSLGIKIIVSRLGISEFGEYYAATSILTAVSLFSLLGIPMSITRFLAINTDNPHRQTVIRSAMTFTILSSVIASLTMIICALLHIELPILPQKPIYAYLIGLAIPFVGFTFMSKAIMLGYLDVTSAYIIEIAETLSRFIGTILFLSLFGAHQEFAFIGFLSGSVVSLVIGISMILHKAGTSSFSFFQWNKSIVTYAWPVSISELFTQATTLIMLYYLYQRGGGQTIGLYGVTITIAGLTHLAPQFILSVFLPLITSRLTNKRGVIQSYITMLIWLVPTVLFSTIAAYILQTTALHTLFHISTTEIFAPLTLAIAAYAYYALVVWPHRQILDAVGLTKSNLFATLLRFGVICAVLGISPLSPLLTASLSLLLGWGLEGVYCLMRIHQQRILHA